MSDTLNVESPSDESAPVRSKRGRRILALVLIVLILLLGLSSYLLYSIFVAPGAEQLCIVGRCRRSDVGELDLRHVQSAD